MENSIGRMFLVSLFPSFQRLAMNRIQQVCFLALFLVGFSLVGASPLRAADVMVLGTFHFANPGLDLVNTEIDDVLAAKRQAEIAAVVDALARFKPTKILLEYPSRQDRGFNSKYRSYKAGDYSLSRNEHDQIGMRLAKQLGHERLYGVDEKLDLDFDSVFEGAGRAGQEKLVARMGQDIEKIRKKIGEIQGPKISIARSLRAHNDPEFDGQEFYVVLAEAGTAKNPTGAKLLADWYRRNALIFANILRLIEDEDERVLVIYGSGHKSLLVDFVKHHPDHQNVSPLGFLPEK